MAVDSRVLGSRLPGTKGGVLQGLPCGVGAQAGHGSVSHLSLPWEEAMSQAEKEVAPQRAGGAGQPALAPGSRCGSGRAHGCVSSDCDLSSHL